MSVAQIVASHPVSPELQAPLRTLQAALVDYVAHTLPEESARAARAQRLAAPRRWAHAE